MNINTPEQLIQLDNPVSKTSKPAWDKQLLVDVAIGTSEMEILEAYDLQAHQLREILEDSTFLVALATLKKELDKDGMSFRLKCQLQAEAMLEENWMLAHDRENVPAETRRKAIADTVRWAGFDNQGGASGLGGGGGFTINVITGSSGRAGVTIEGEKE
jgi:hypothetical protein